MLYKYAHSFYCLLYFNTSQETILLLLIKYLNRNACIRYKMANFTKLFYNLWQL